MAPYVTIQISIDIQIYTTTGIYILMYIKYISFKLKMLLLGVQLPIKSIPKVPLVYFFSGFKLKILFFSGVRYFEVSEKFNPVYMKGFA